MRVFATDPITKTVERFWWDPVDESFVIETRQDVTDCVELTQAEFAMIDERAPWKGDLHKVASIPMTVVAELQRQGIWQDDAKLRKWLDDRDNRRFRTRPGRLSK